jgi:NADH-quinone oxidoreductase subunit G
MNKKADTQLVKIFINGKETYVSAQTNILEAAKKVGIEIPHFCYHSKLSISGNCRMCLVEIAMPQRDRATGKPILDENGKEKLAWNPRPVISCATKPVEGMHVRTDSEIVKQCRKAVMEFLLINHPLDCPICDQAGECSLQEFAIDYGRGYSRFKEDKNVKPKRTRLGPRVILDNERCILCSRCIRFCEEILNDKVLGFIDRGSYSTLTCYPGKELANNYSLNTVDICPVGALTSTDFRFKMRVWFLKQTKSICTESSVGVNIFVSSREGKIYRITPRRNDAVNDTWMPDSGRLLYKTVQSKNRLKKYTIDQEECSGECAVKKAAQLIQEDKHTAFVASGKASVEEQFLLKQIVDASSGNATLVNHIGEGDNFLISADRTPNLRGALVTGLIKELPDSDLTALAQKIDTGQIKTLVSQGEDLTAEISEELLDKITIIYLGTHANTTSEKSRVVIPTLTVFEKNGSFINQQFRLQNFEQAVPGPLAVFPDIRTLSMLAHIMGTKLQEMTTLSQVWQVMSKSIKILSAITFENIPDTGQLIDGSSWEKFPFVEGDSLHYTPKNK